MGEQKIPWARISAEAAVIVVSILLAFAKAGELLEMIRARLAPLDA